MRNRLGVEGASAFRLFGIMDVFLPLLTAYAHEVSRRVTHPKLCLDLCEAVGGRVIVNFAIVEKVAYKRDESMMAPPYNISEAQKEK